MAMLAIIGNLRKNAPINGSRDEESKHERYISYGEAPPTPWLVPPCQNLELMFFKKVFDKLEEDLGAKGCGGDGDVPLPIFQRAMTRLFRVLQDERSFDAKRYDINDDGTVGWWEFCLLWKDEQLSVKLSMAERIHLTLEDPQMSRLGKITSLGVLAAIVISAGSFIIGTMPSMQEPLEEGGKPEPFAVFQTIDTVCVVLFTIEYILRLGTAAFMRMELTNHDELIQDICTDECISWPTKMERVRSFVLAWPNIIDAAAILPSYIAIIIEEMSSGSNTGDDGSEMVFKLIKLGRVVRAFRLGRRFEAVIIIARSMQKSVRALWVLVLNICLGMLIFGSVIFFIEQGQYDPITKGYFRMGWSDLDPQVAADSSFLVNREWTEEPTPFESIPHAFWWALVTATTVGYGDVSPTSFPGQICAGVAMIWSLCVIALPVGVIGANFALVWEEYDAEKQKEKKMKQMERSMVKDTVQSLEPLLLSRRLVVEVMHDTTMRDEKPDRLNDVFLGEAEVDMKVSPDSGLAKVEQRLELPLHENRSKAARKVTGSLSVSYTWEASASSEPGVVLEGKLIVKVVSGEGFAAIDWKEGELPDPYVVVTCYPLSPEKPGKLVPEKYHTDTEWSAAGKIDKNWQWDKEFRFDFKWLREHVNSTREINRTKTLATQKSIINRQTSVATGMLSTPRGQTPRGGSGASSLQAFMSEAVPQMQQDFEQLRGIMAQQQAEVESIRKDTASILEALGVRRPAQQASSAPASSPVPRIAGLIPGSGIEARPQDLGGAEQTGASAKAATSPRPGASARDRSQLSTAVTEPRRPPAESGQTEGYKPAAEDFKPLLPLPPGVVPEESEAQDPSGRTVC